jgi:predicted nucleotidyltransferase
MRIPADSLAAVERVMGAHHEVLAVYMFGSRARDSARPDSDIDLGVLYRVPQTLETTLRIEEELQRAAGSHVDLVDVCD